MWTGRGGRPDDRPWSGRSLCDRHETPSSAGGLRAVGGGDRKAGTGTRRYGVARRGRLTVVGRGGRSATRRETPVLCRRVAGRGWWRPKGRDGDEEVRRCAPWPAHGRWSRRSLCDRRESPRPLPAACGPWVVATERQGRGRGGTALRAVAGSRSLVEEVALRRHETPNPEEDTFSNTVPFRTYVR